MKYYYLKDVNRAYIVTSISRGGSHAGNINGFNKLDSGDAPLLFNDKKDAEFVWNKEGRGSSLEYWWEETGKKRTTVMAAWTICEVDLEINLLKD